MIDLRSDTVTKPTKAMREAAFYSEVGDDVYGEDPAVNQLEETAANMLGKEAALFVTSGTQGNQIAVLTHCRQGNEVILEADSHIYLYEGAAISAFAGVQPRPIEGERGAMEPEKVAATIRSEDIHFPETGLICLENTHNKAGGAVVPLENMKRIYQVAKENQIPVHLDGARLFNAAATSGISVEKYAACTDTVQFCLSKGLGAPVGSIITGSKEFIKIARKWRKRLGGGLRQAGIIASPALAALTENAGRLVDDHRNAQVLADGIGDIAGLYIENQVDTNIVMVHVAGAGYGATEFTERLKEYGILCGAFGPKTVRLVTHYGISREDIVKTISKVELIAKSQAYHTTD